jgi:5'-nucleotidase / UDP-sugar diphosphatase
MNATRRAAVVASFVAAAAIAGALGRSAGAASDVVHLTIVHTNDLHGYVENCPAIAAFARSVKAKNPNTLFLDAGDCITGTPVSTTFQGEPVFEVMSLMGYDAGAIGNHEFDHGWRKLAKFRELAAHPLLCANAADPDGKPFGDAAWRVFDVGGARVGVVGLLSDDMPRLTTAANWAGCTIESPLAAAKRLVPEVRKQCDVCVLLTHVGVEVDAAIAGAVPGVDLVVGGHSHTELKTPLSVRGVDRNVPVAQAFRYGERVGVLDFDWDPTSKSVKAFKGRLVTIDATSPKAADVEQLVAKWTRLASEKNDLSAVIGMAPRKLSRADLRAALERIYADALHADFGYQNLHGVRADVEAGEIRAEQVWKVLPFDNALVKVRLRGDQLPEFARKTLGARFDAAKEYVIATNSYVGDQQKKYFGVQGAPVEKTDLEMRATVLAWVKEHGGFPTGLADRGADEEKR